MRRANMLDMKLLDRKCSNGSQSLELVSLWAYPDPDGECDDHKLRVRRKRDSCTFQSWAVCERWDGAKWQEVSTIHYGSMAGGSGDDCYVSKAKRPNDAESADERELLRLAKLVL